MTILILANTANAEYYTMLEECVKNIPARYRVVVVETNYKLEKKTIPLALRCKFLFPKLEFNYNKYINIGLHYIEHTSRDNKVVISNNDIIYSPTAIAELDNALNHYDSVCPWDTNDPVQTAHINNKGSVVGNQVGIHIIGCCIGTWITTIKKIGGFDERFKFWYQDNDYADLIRKHNISHAIIPQAKIIHLGRQSHKLVTNLKEYTNDQEAVYYQKLNENSNTSTEPRENEQPADVIDINTNNSKQP